MTTGCKGQVKMKKGVKGPFDGVAPTITEIGWNPSSVVDDRRMIRKLPCSAKNYFVKY